MIQQSPEVAAPREPQRRPCLQREVCSRYETLLHRLSWPSDGSLRTLGITSCRSGEGVSTIAAHLAVTAASLGDRRILLVDANFTRPYLPRIFSARSRPGLAEILRDGQDLSEVLQPSTAANLSLLAAGRANDGAAHVYNPAGLPGFIKELAKDHDLVVVDLPAVSCSNAAIRLAGMLDGVLLVVEACQVRREVARQAADLLVRAGSRPLGVVLNKWRRHVPDWLNPTL